MKFSERLEKPGFLLLDGGMGTLLQRGGMPAGVAPEMYCLANPEILEGIHRQYAAAGADILTTCTFGASRYKLPPDADVFDVNRSLCQLAAKVAAESPGKVFVAGDIGPSGLFLRPLGPLDPRDLVAAFSEQIRGLVAGGAELLLIETQFDLAEARAAVVAAREVCDLPVIVSMTFEAGTCLTGSTPDIFAQTMLNLGVDVVGTNCSTGPEQMRPVVEALLASGAQWVMAEPNAGMPVLEGGRTTFPLPPAPFAEETARFAAMGAKVLGGCCGTTPAHIAALAQALKGVPFVSRPAALPDGVHLTTRSTHIHIGAGQPFALIGERINPTGKSQLSSELLQNDFTCALRLAEEQAEAGATVLDVNVGAPLADETALLPQLALLLSSRLDVPLCLDSPDIAALRAAIPYAPGSWLVNSINGEGDRMETLGAVCRDYGAPFILLPISGTRLPRKASARIATIENLLQRAEALHIPRRLILVDVLALSISANADAGKEALEMIRWCAAHGLPTTIGLSNVSFGLPARELLNSTFLSLAAGAGLSSCIANPCASRIAEAVAAIRVLQGHDPDAAEFIAGYSGWTATSVHAAAKNGKTHSASLYDTILNGDVERMEVLLQEELDAGAKPLSLINDVLIPAITEVGARFEKRQYFLPQLIRSAETMQRAFGRLEPLLRENAEKTRRPVVVMATVEGDIHDIGKNIVCLLLGNHGFEVIDAGKDLPAEKIVECAREHGASIIGLSALMTTTMVRMEDTIRLVKEQNLPIKIMVGGAAVTPAFAESIGADGYSADAVEAVRLAQSLTGGSVA